jgi:class 3 adenylate cyclase
MVDCVFRHGGTLDKFIGDCVMAQWGAPEGAPDDADRALRAALDMHGALAALNARRAELGRPALAMGVGLAHGDVFAGNIGSERRLEFTVIGDAVNQASRLCDAAGPGEVLVSDPLRRALRGPPPRLRPVPPAALAGDARGEPVYVVLTDGETGPLPGPPTGDAPDDGPDAPGGASGAPLGGSSGAVSGGAPAAGDAWREPGPPDGDRRA